MPRLRQVPRTGAPDDARKVYDMLLAAAIPSPSPWRGWGRPSGTRIAAVAEATDAYFFSYSRKDAAFVLRLAKELRDAGARLWLDQLDIVGGQRWDEAVERALRTCRGVIVVLSPDSVASSNVMDEVAFALEEGKRVVPVIHEPCEIPFRLRRLQYVDFGTGHAAGVQALLTALGSEVAPPPARVARPGPRRPLHALAGFATGAPLAGLALLVTSLLPTETRPALGGPDGTAVFLGTSLVAGLLGAATGWLCGSDRRRILTVIGATVAVWAIGLGIDPRYEGTQVGVLLGPIAGNLLAPILARRGRPAK